MNVKNKFQLDFKKSQKIFFMIVFICVIAIPECIVISLYSAIIFSLKRNAIATCQGSSNSMAARRLQEDIKVVRNIIAILIAFCVSTNPFIVVAFMFHFVWDFKIPCNMKVFVFVVHLIFYLHALVNPFIYYIFNDKYRQSFLKIFRQVSLSFSCKKNRKKKKNSRNLIETSMWPTTDNCRLLEIIHFILS